MWIEKVPRRFDFCGCPGCPLCYDWADDAPVALALETGALTQEIQQPPTFDEQMILIYGTQQERPKTLKEYEYCHIYVHSGQLEKEEAEAQQSVREAEHAMWFDRWLTHERRYPRVERKLPNLVTCDSIGGEEIERRLTEEQKQKILTTALTAEEQEKQVYANALASQQASMYQQRNKEREQLISNNGSIPVGTTVYSAAVDGYIMWNGRDWVRK